MDYPEVKQHSLPVALTDRLYVVHGCVNPSAIARFTRNMAIIRENDDLTLINPVRMDAEGLVALEALGNIKHVLRLGPMHGMDDPFYVDRYKADFWSLAGGETYQTPPITRPLGEGEPLPFSDADLFVFNHLKEPEGAILLKEGPGVLLTTDSIQSYKTPPHTPHTNVLTRIMMPFIGFPRKTLIGPVWLKLLATDPECIRDEFRRLIALEFDQLLSAHGTFLAANAKAEVREAFLDRFGEAP